MTLNPKNRAQSQNAAIEQADALLSAAGLPTWTELAETVDDLLRTSIPAYDPNANMTRTSAEKLLDRACGSSPALWVQQVGRAYRPGKHPRDLAHFICAAATCEDVALDHFRIRAPADRLDAVRAHVEAHRIARVNIEYLPLETDK